MHNVVDRGVLQALWEEIAGAVGNRDQLIWKVCSQTGKYFLSVHLGMVYNAQQNQKSTTVRTA